MRFFADLNDPPRTFVPSVSLVGTEGLRDTHADSKVYVRPFNAVTQSSTTEVRETIDRRPKTFSTIAIAPSLGSNATTLAPNETVLKTRWRLRLTAGEARVLREMSLSDHVGVTWARA